MLFLAHETSWALALRLREAKDRLPRIRAQYAETILHGLRFVKDKNEDPTPQQVTRLYSDLMIFADLLAMDLAEKTGLQRAMDLAYARHVATVLLYRLEREFSPSKCAK